MTVPWLANTFAECSVKWVLPLFRKPFEPDTVKTYLQKIMADL